MSILDINDNAINIFVIDWEIGTHFERCFLLLKYIENLPA